MDGWGYLHQVSPIVLHLNELLVNGMALLSVLIRSGDGCQAVRRHHRLSTAGELTFTSKPLHSCHSAAWLIMGLSTA